MVKVLKMQRMQRWGGVEDGLKKEEEEEEKQAEGGRPLGDGGEMADGRWRGRAKDQGQSQQGQGQSGMGRREV